MLNTLYESLIKSQIDEKLFKKAITTCEKALKYPDNSIWKIHQQKAFAYLNLKKPTDAKKEFIKAIEFSPENQIPVVEF